MPSSSRTQSVLIIGPAPPPYGGMALQGQALVERLRGDGIDVVFLATNPSIPWIIAKLAGLRTLMQAGIFLWNLCRELTRQSVVHVLGASHWYFVLRVLPTILLSKFFGRRLILNYRGGEAPMFFARYRWLVMSALRLVDGIVVPSTYLHRVFVGYGFATTIIPNFVDLRRFRYHARRKLTPRLLVNRTLEPLYNVRMALEAFSIIKKHHSSARLDVVGGGSEAAILRDWVSARNLQGVYFHGPVPNEAVPRYLDDADILLNPSNADNMPISLMEAFAAGVPVVSTNVGGIPDMVSRAGAALLVGAGDCAAMAARVEELLNDSEQVSELTRRAKSLVEEMSWERISRRWLQIYFPDAPAVATNPESSLEIPRSGTVSHE